MRKRRDVFQIHKVRRVYDRQQGKFSFDISYSTTVRLTPRTTVVAEAFGLGIDEEHRFKVLDVELKIGLEDIVYITGDSGSGKSVLLRALKEDLGTEALDLTEVNIDLDKPLIETVGKNIEEGLVLLSKVGLSDAFLFLRSFSELSDGQKYRYKIAKLLETKAQFWILDEFAATLDRDTAKIVAFNLQKCAREQGKTVLAATTHTDLFQDLGPNVHIHKRFGKEIQVNYYSNTCPVNCSLVKEMHIEEGSTADWRALSIFHYRSHKIPAPRKIFCLKRGWHELCGVIVYSYPPSTCFGRKLMLQKTGMKELNQKLNNISRVVVHPKYRTIGLGVKLVRETLALAGTECVEMSAVMAKYNPFAERAGMQKVIMQQPSKEALKIAAVLETLGFNIELLGSLRYVTKKIESLEVSEIQIIKDAFLKSRHTRFLKSFSYNLPYGRTEDYRKKIEEASVERLAKLIKICSFLNQVKVYLFWSLGQIQTEEHRQLPYRRRERTVKSAKPKSNTETKRRVIRAI
jgi:ABC-type transport system involved in cytochrome c biogenesis ATPase subunit/GNAT superfamily N-acetyltransferase